jgi:hypothetical protein
VTGRLALRPGEACQPPGDVFGRVLEGLTAGEMESMLIGISVYHPEVFEEALADVQAIRDRRARYRARIKGGAR